jgi:hypothetical protein
MTLDLTLHDWRLMERVVGLIGRLGCAYTRLDVRAERDRYRASLDLVGTPDALRRLDAQLTRLCNDDKEMSR